LRQNKIVSALVKSNLNELEAEALISLLTQGDQVEVRMAREALVLQGSAVLSLLIEAAKAAPGDRELWRLLITMAEIGGPEIVPTMIEALRSNNSAISSVAAQCLSNLKDARAVDPMLELLNHRNPNTSAIWIIDALGKLGAKRAVKPLIALLHTTQSVPERYTAVEVLGLLGDHTVAEEISKYANDPDHHVRDRVKVALTRLRHQ
jgi:HEAT repeat protein